jgi:hypothetical protein
MKPSTSRFIVFGLGVAALALAGCANTGGANGLFGETATRPKTILVADFVASPEVEAAGTARGPVRHRARWRIARRAGRLPACGQ